LKVNKLLQEDTKSIFEIKDLRRGQGVTFGNLLRRSIISEDSGFKVIGVRIAGGGQLCSTVFKSIEGVTDDVISLFIKINSLFFESKMQYEAGDVVRFSYVGNKKLITLSDLIPSQADATLRVLSNDGDSELIHNIGEVEINLDIIVCWNIGYVTKDANYILISEKNLDVKEYLITDTTHCRVKNASYKVEENELGESVIFDLELVYGDASKVLRSTINSLIESLTELRENF
jgi:DNA-directed RNA polymerase subunit alpha